MVDKEAFVHHADNVRLTSEYLNMAKLDDIPIVLRIAKDAIGINKDDPLRVSLLELAFDHAFRIRTVLPRSIKQRKELAHQQSPEWWKRFHHMMLNGIYDGLKPIYDFFFNLDLSSSSVWDDATIKRLDLLCREIEASPFYKPKGLTLPRGSSNHGSAPWLWNILHKFDDLNWEYLGRLFATRFKRMDDDCDFANDHDNECAETVFLTCVILWFRSDGKDEILGLHMTVFSRHALRFALHVEPGSIMRTGWTQKHPDSLSQYKEALRTIAMETWFMNRAKFHYPVTPENIELFKTLLRDISLDTPGWQGYPAQYTSANLQFPRSCRKNRSRPLDPESDISREDEEEVASEIGENLLDNEDLAMGFVFGGEVDDDDEGLEDVLSDDGSGEEEEEQNEQGETKASKGHEHGSTGRAGDDEDFLDADVNYLLDGQKYFPANERAKYVEAVMRLAHNRMSGTTRTTVAAPSRLELFEQAIITWATEQGTGLDITMEELAQTTLWSWQSLNPRINAEFTLEEITAFCAELDDKDNFM